MTDDTSQTQLSVSAATHFHIAGFLAKLIRICSLSVHKVIATGGLE